MSEPEIQSGDGQGALAAELGNSVDAPVLSFEQSRDQLTVESNAAQIESDAYSNYLASLEDRSGQSEILRSVLQEVTRDSHTLRENISTVVDEDGSLTYSRQLREKLRTVFIDKIASHQAINLQPDESSDVPDQLTDVPDVIVNELETLYGAVSLIDVHLTNANVNEASGSFILARSLTWARGVLNGVRNLGFNKVARAANNVTGRNGLGSKVVTAGATFGGGYIFRQAIGRAVGWAAPVGFASAGLGLTVQRMTYRSMMARELAKPENSSFTREYINNLIHDRSLPEVETPIATNGTLNWLGRRLNSYNRFLPVRVWNETKASYNINADYLYQLGKEAHEEALGGDQSKYCVIEKYAAVLQNSIDERIGAGECILETDQEQQALIAALQIMCDSTVKLDPGEGKLESYNRMVGVDSGFTHVQTSRKEALIKSSAAGVLVGATFATTAAVISHADQIKSLLSDTWKHVFSGSSNPVPAEAPTLPHTTLPHAGNTAGAAATTGGIGAGMTNPAPALVPAPSVETAPVSESLTDHIHSATAKIFGITKENAEHIDSAHAEHLVRERILHDLKIGRTDAAGNIEFTQDDRTWLTGHGIVFNAEGNLDFSQAHEDVAKMITEHLHQWEQASNPLSVTPAVPELTDVVRNMQFTQMDHELMLTVSREYKMDLAELRELRWEAGSDMSKLFADHKLAWHNLLKDHQLKVGDRLLKLEQAPGINPMEKTRWIMRQWLESRKVTGGQIGPVLADKVGVVAEPQQHWLFGTPIPPTVDQVIPTGHPALGAARSTVGQANPFNLNYSTENVAHTPNPFTSAVRHSLPGLNPENTTGTAGHSVDTGVAHNGFDKYVTTSSAPREALPTGSRVETVQSSPVEVPQARVNVVDVDGHAAQAARANTTSLRPNMTGEAVKPNLAEPKSGLNPLSAPAAKVEHPNSLEHNLFGKSAPDASGQPLPALADRVPVKVEGPSVDADDTSKIPSLQESD